MRWPERPYPTLTQRQREYLLGALLGDDSVLMNHGSAHAHLRAQQSMAHREYLMWKYEMMKNFTLIEPRQIVNRRYDKIHHGIRFHTRATPELTVIHHLCYPQGRKAISLQWLRQLTPFSLAVWYMDDGTYCSGRHTCMLYTGAFPRNQQRVLRAYLRAQWGITGCVIQRNRRQWCLRFTRLGTQQLLSLIEPHVLPSMEYKLGGSAKAWKRAICENMNRYLHAWRSGEDAVLRTNYGSMPAMHLAEQLGRTLDAVYLRARKLGLDGWKSDRVSDGPGIYRYN